MSDFAKRYIEASKVFRSSNASPESIEKLYDLLYEMQECERTKHDDITLSNLYTLLGFHQSAYELFKTASNPSDRKAKSKLFVMEEKAKSHKDTFIIKDPRKQRAKIKPVKLEAVDFKKSDDGDNKYELTEKDIVVFNNLIKKEKVEMYVYGENTFEDFVLRIIGYIKWLHDCKTELIEFYNQNLQECTKTEADDNWYYGVEVFSVRIIVGQNGNLYSEISAGDEIAKDHILDIETENDKIIAMRYDG